MTADMTPNCAMCGWSQARVGLVCDACRALLALSVRERRELLGATQEELDRDHPLPKEGPA
jgi:hypothetical protein